MAYPLRISHISLFEISELCTQRSSRLVGFILPNNQLSNSCFMKNHGKAAWIQNKHRRINQNLQKQAQSDALAQRAELGQKD